MKTVISDKTLQDLEFPLVLEQVCEFCISSLGKEKIRNTQPIPKIPLLFFELRMVNEYLSSFENENRIPNHDFDNINEVHLGILVNEQFIKKVDFLIPKDA